MIGCATYQPMEPGVFYKRDMKFAVDGIGEFEGVQVLPKRMSYKFEIEPKNDSPDLLIVRSCHREDSFEKNQSGFSFFKKKDKKYLYEYEPVPDVEVGRVCPLRGDSLHMVDNNSVHSWFFVDFESQDDGYTIIGELVCNAERETIQGVAVCQARTGLVQTIQFREKIRWATPKPDGCNEWVHKGYNRYEVVMNKGECLYHAYNINKELFRITTIGFEGINLRQGY